MHLNASGHFVWALINLLICPIRLTLWIPWWVYAGDPSLNQSLSPFPLVPLNGIWELIPANGQLPRPRTGVVGRIENYIDAMDKVCRIMSQAVWYITVTLMNSIASRLTTLHLGTFYWPLPFDIQWTWRHRKHMNNKRVLVLMHFFFGTAWFV